MTALLRDGRLRAALRQLARADARVKLFDGAGHLLYWEQPKRFARMVTRFLAGPPTPAREPTTAIRRVS